MTSHRKALLTVLALSVLFGVTLTAGSTASSQHPSPITLQSVGNSIEASEQAGSIFLSEDEKTLNLVGARTGGVEAYRFMPDGSLQNVGRKAKPVVGGPRGYGLTVENEKITVFDPSGQIANRFIAYPPVSLAFLNTDEIAVAAPTGEALLHVYGRDGRLLRSFGAIKRRDSNELENRFLNRGKILIDAAGSIYYVYTYVPLIQKYSPSGELQYEVEVSGEAIDIQQPVAQRFLQTKQPREVGGIDIITAAAIERQTGHVWIGMSGSSKSAVVYEYSGRGQKLAEYVLQAITSPDTTQNIIGVRDIAVTKSALYALAPDGQVYSFGRKGGARGKSVGRAPNTPVLAGAPVRAFAPASPRPPVALDAACAAAQAWGGCSFNCPGPGLCVSNQPPPDTSDSSVKDCKQALVDSLTGSYTVVGSSCVTYTPNTPSHTHGGCHGEVTICIDGTNTNHTVTLDCPAQTCSSGGGGGDGFECDMNTSCSNTDEYCDCKRFAGSWSESTCHCDAASPILVDVEGDGFTLTDAADGVNFDLDGDGAKEHLAWTSAGSDDAWLALDRNGNGVIDNGQELFGNFTPQSEPPAGVSKNGFNALAEYDKPEQGGNYDGVIDAGDAIFASLRLWQDTNHDGVSEPSELHTLAQLGLRSIDLNYKESKRTDQYGNRFRYRAKVGDAKGAQLGRWAWDVFLTRGQTARAPIQPRGPLSSFVETGKVDQFGLLGVPRIDAAPAAPARAKAAAVSVGSNVALPGVNWADSKQTLLLVLQSGCHFCSDSADFYRQLAGEGGARAGTKLVALLPGTVIDSKKYLEHLGVQITDVRQADMGALGVGGTPTLLLVDDKGMVTRSWVGRLRPDKEEEVISAVRGDSR